ncbi:MAG: hypothetical protein WB586_13965 [Chthoniobacterales bacterium]
MFSRRAQPAQRRRNNAPFSAGWERPDSGNARRPARIAVRGLFLAGLVAALAVGLSVLAPSLFDSADSGNKTLELTGQDIDPETTTVAKTLLRQNQVSRSVAPELLIEARQKLLGNDLLEAENAVRLGRLSPALAPLAKNLADDLENGKAAAFTIWVEPDDEAQGQAVDIQLAGVDLGKFDVSSNRYAITLIYRTGSTSRIQLTGVNDSPAVFKAETASSEARTRRLRMGKSDFWELNVR